MKHIELDEKEIEFLAKILESYLSDLKTERAHTDNREMRLELKVREAMVTGLIEQIRS